MIRQNVPTVRRKAVASLMALAIAAFMLIAPYAVVACTCVDPPMQGDVVFTGTVTDSPDRSILLRDMFEGSAGVYMFAVESVTRGDPMDGRVYTSFGHGGCGRVFELGATYRVHADVVDPDAEYLGRRPGVPLVTGTCMSGELLEPPDPVVVIKALAFTPEGIALTVVGLGLVAGAGLYVRHRARRRVLRPPTDLADSHS